jgi:DNA-binding response OmpR family regulator
MAKIAIIDDDPDIVEAVGTLLELKGHKVVSASDIDSGYDLISNEKPDIVILDVMMQEPDDGFYLALKLRRNGFSMPIIMLTSVAKATGLDFGAGGSVPVNEFLEKPIQSNVLIGMINDYLSN